jgi:hypothetical protein
MATAQKAKDKARSRAGAGKAERGTARTRHGGEAEHGATIPIPVPEIHTRLVSLPEKMGQARRTLAGQRRSSGRLAFYGALAAGAAFGIIDWPVAAAIGLGTVIARRGRS